MSGKFRSREEFQKVREQFFSNCRKREYPDDEVNEIWRQIESFAGYSFAKGHSASYAVESYQSLYLKAYFPMEFMVGVINNFGGFYSTEYYLHEARMSGAQVELPCINRSRPETCIYERTIFIGFNHIKELEAKTVEAIMIEKMKAGEFTSLQHFLKRVGISLLQLRILIRIGAFRFVGKTKKELLWEAHLLLSGTKKSVPRPELFDSPPKEYKLPPLEHSVQEDFIDEIEILGFPYHSPFDMLETSFRGELMAKELVSHEGKIVRMVGYYVTIKKVTTIKNQRMNFGCFVDAKGDFFDTVHFPQSLNRYPFTGKGCYLLKGKVTQEFGVTSLDVFQMARLRWETDESPLTHAKVLAKRKEDRG
jgi:DNA polymerase-3 subunit alpha